MLLEMNSVSRIMCDKKLSLKLRYYRLLRALNLCLFSFRLSWTVNTEHVRILNM